MKILMISTDKSFVSERSLGDVIERHKEYGRHVDVLDIIVQCKHGYKEKEITDNVHSYPTHSSFKISYASDARKIARKLFLRNKYDLIVTQDPFLTGWAGLHLKRKYKTKLLVHLHGDFIDNPLWLKED